MRHVVVLVVGDPHQNMNIQRTSKNNKAFQQVDTSPVDLSKPQGSAPGCRLSPVESQVPWGSQSRCPRAGCPHRPRSERERRNDDALSLMNHWGLRITCAGSLIQSNFNLHLDGS